MSPPPAVLPSTNVVFDLVRNTIVGPGRDGIALVTNTNTPGTGPTGHLRIWSNTVQPSGGVPLIDVVASGSGTSVCVDTMQNSAPAIQLTQGDGAVLAVPQANDAAINGTNVVGVVWVNGGLTYSATCDISGFDVP